MLAFFVILVIIMIIGIITLKKCKNRDDDSQ